MGEGPRIEGARRLQKQWFSNAGFREAEALLLERFGRVTLAALSADFHARLAARGGTLTLEQAHAV